MQADLGLASFKPASMAQFDACPTEDQVAGSTPAELATFFVEIDHKLFSTGILSLPLIQEVVSFWRKNVYNTD